MTLFAALFVGHLTGDFLLQTAWMARYKNTRWRPLLAHVTVYTLVVAAAGFWHGGLSWWAVAWVFVTHAAIDRNNFVRWWGRTVQGVSRQQDAWLLIVTDQVFHIIALVVAVWISRSGI